MEKKIPLSVRTFLNLLHFRITMEQIDPNTITIPNLDNIVINLGYIKNCASTVTFVISS